VRVAVGHAAAAEPAPPVYRVAGGQAYRPAPYRVERDYSQAAFWLAADSGHGRLHVAGLAADSCQGDREIVRLLADFAAGRQMGRTAYEIDASQIPDLVPVLAVAATQVDAVTRIVRAARLRLKESDRLASTTAALAAIGADIAETEDGLVVAGGRFSRFGSELAGGEADSAGDHRIAMALAVAALHTRAGVTIRGAECVRKSYPDFFQEFKRLGGDVHGLHLG
jgi:3-phosphoshikimate 1-carboxyvinyltransferase